MNIYSHRSEITAYHNEHANTLVLFWLNFYLKLSFLLLWILIDSCIIERNYFRKVSSSPLIVSKVSSSFSIKTVRRISWRRILYVDRSRVMNLFLVLQSLSWLMKSSISESNLGGVQQSETTHACDAMHWSSLDVIITSMKNLWFAFVIISSAACGVNCSNHLKESLI